MMKMKMLSRAAVAAAALATAPFASAECLQDQYGNLWDITLDTVHKSITGVMTVTQRGGLQWVISGSYIGGAAFRIQQLTASDSEIGQSMYMLKGTYPNFAWYYNGVYGEQEAAWVPCGSPVAPGAVAARGGVNR